MESSKVYRLKKGLPAAFQHLRRTCWWQSLCLPHGFNFCIDSQMWGLGVVVPRARGKLKASTSQSLTFIGYRAGCCTCFGYASTFPLSPLATEGTYHANNAHAEWTKYRTCGLLLAETLARFMWLGNRKGNSCHRMFRQPGADLGRLENERAKVGIHREGIKIATYLMYHRRFSHVELSAHWECYVGRCPGTLQIVVWQR